METPAWALTLAFWLHMVATVIWIGGLAALAILVLPAARRVLTASAYADLLAGVQRRFDPAAWFSLVVLAATGMFQMSANPNYGGFLAIDNRWSTAILIKHILFFGMAGLSAYLTWGVLPKTRRLALMRSRLPDAESDSASPIAAQELRLIQLNLFLGVIILALTAVARAA